MGRDARVRFPRWRLVVLGGLALLAAGAAGLLIALPRLVDLPRVRAWIVSEASRRLERPVEFERLSVRYEPLPSFRVTRLTVANAKGFGIDPLLVVEEARFQVDLRPLFRGRLQLGEIMLERPRIVLEQRRDGTWNLPPPSALRAAAAPLGLVSRARLRGGQAEVRLPGAADRPWVYRLDGIVLDVDDVGRSRPIGVRLSATLREGVGVEVEGEVGPLAVAGGDVAAVPARLSARLSADERRMPEGSAFAVTGVGGGAVRLDGHLGQLAGDGRLAFRRLTVAHQPATCRSPTSRVLTFESVALSIHVSGPVVTLRPFAFRVADGSVQGDAVVGWRAGRPEVRLSDVRVQGVTAERVLVDFLCHPYAVAGRLDGSAMVAFEGTDADPWRAVRGHWRVDVERGRLVGPAALALASRIAQIGLAPFSEADWALPGVPSAAPVDFRRLAAVGTVEAGEVWARELRWTSPQTRITGAGRYGLSDRRLDFQLGVEAGPRVFAVQIAGTAQQPALSPLAQPPARGQADVNAAVDAAVTRSGSSAP